MSCEGYFLLNFLTGSLLNVLQTISWWYMCSEHGQITERCNPVGCDEPIQWLTSTGGEGTDLPDFLPFQLSTSATYPLSALALVRPYPAWKVQVWRPLKPSSCNLTTWVFVETSVIKKKNWKSVRCQKEFRTALRPRFVLQGVLEKAELRRYGASLMCRVGPAAVIWLQNSQDKGCTCNELW